MAAVATTTTPASTLDQKAIDVEQIAGSATQAVAMPEVTVVQCATQFVGPVTYSAPATYTSRVTYARPVQLATIDNLPPLTGGPIAFKFEAESVPEEDKPKVAVKTKKRCC